MPRQIIIYSKPDDPDRFVTHYVETHMKLAGKVPGMRSASAGLVANSSGLEPSPYLAAVLHWESPEAMKKGMTTPEWQELVADAGKLDARPFAMLLVNEAAS